MSITYVNTGQNEELAQVETVFLELTQAIYLPDTPDKNFYQRVVEQAAKTFDVEFSSIVTLENNFATSLALQHPQLTTLEYSTVDTPCEYALISEQIVYLEKDPTRLNLPALQSEQPLRAYASVALVMDDPKRPAGLLVIASQKPFEKWRVSEKFIQIILAMLGRLVAAELRGLRTLAKTQARNEHRFEALVRNSFDLVAVLRADATFSYLSPSLQPILGYAPEDLLNTRSFDIIHPEDCESLLKGFSYAIQRPGYTLKTRFRARRTDGTWAYIEAGGNNLIDDPTVEGLVINARDISDQIQTENAVRESEKRFRLMIENSSEIILVLNADMIINYVSPSVETILGYTPEEALDKPLTFFIDIQDKQNAQINEALKRLLKTPNELQKLNEYKVLHKDGTIHFFEAIATNLLHVPDIKGLVINCRDVTERKIAEMNLQAEVNFVFHIMNTMGQGLTVADANTRLEYVNPAYAAMLGYTQAELIGKTAYDLTPLEDLHYVKTALSNRQSNKVTTYQKRILRKDGSIIYVEVTGAPRWRDGKILGSVAVVTDLTERLKIEEAQRRQQEYQITLHQTALSLIKRLDITDLLQAIVTRAAGLLRSRHGFVALLDANGKFMRVRVGAGEITADKFFRAAKNEGLLGIVWQTGEPILLNDYPNWAQGELDSTLGKIQAAVAVPLKSSDQVVGVIGLLHFKEGRTFDQDQLQVLGQFANLASLALDNARLYSDAQRRLSELSTIENIARVINSKLDLEEVFQTVIQQISQAFGFEMMGIYLRHDDELHLKAFLGYRPEDILHVVSLDTAVSGRVARTGVAAFIQNAANDPDFVYADNEVKQAIIVPFKDGENEVAGVLLVESKMLDALTEDDFNLMSLLANQVSIAVENARLFAEVGRSEEKYRDVVNNVQEVIFQTNNEGNWTFLNPAWEKLLGYTIHESLGTYALSYIYKEDRRVTYDTFIEMIQSVNDQCRFETRLVAKSGAVCWVELVGRSLSHLPGEKGLAVMGTLRDITDRKLTEEALRQAEAKYRSMLENSVEGIYQTSPDHEGSFHYANNAMARMLGYESPEELLENIGSVRRDFYTNPARRAEFVRLLENNNSLLDFDSQVYRKDGSIIWVSEQARVVRDEQGKILYYEGMLHDVTDRRRAEEADRKYRAVVDSVREVIFQTDAGGFWTFLNSAWGNVTGYPIEDSLNRCLLDFVHGQDYRRVAEGLIAVIRRQCEEYRDEARFLTKDGNSRWMQIRIRLTVDESGTRRGTSGTLNDITERKIAQEELHFKALHDTLTELPNRTLFLKRLKESIDRSRRKISPSNFAVLYLDLDRFKYINDSLGHLVGDKLLKATAKKLENCLRPSDLVARLGGDEFTVLLENVEVENQAINVADRILRELAKPFTVEGQEVFTTASIGIAFSWSGYSSPEDLLRAADTALYRAKAQGKSRYIVFDTGMYEETVKTMQLETELRRAIEREEFVVYYQPIIVLKTGRISGFEALIRWNHPQRGIVGPVEFIGLAEETGMIVQIGWMMLIQSCRQLKAWQDLFPEQNLTVNVNLSSRQFLQPDLIEQVKQALDESGLSPSSLKLEITESIFMEDAEFVGKALIQLRSMGVKLYLDDFGTGYSSLSYLHRFPIDGLKIDRSFVSQMSLVGGNAEIAKTIITLAHSMDMDATAEGVETIDQIARLRALKCEFAQGYWFAKPLPAEKVITWMEDYAERPFE